MSRSPLSRECLGATQDHSRSDDLMSTGYGYGCRNLFDKSRREVISTGDTDKTDCIHNAGVVQYVLK